MASATSVPAKTAGASRLKKGVQLYRSVTVNRSLEDCYQFLRNFENAPRFITRLKSITPVSETKWHCIAHLHNGKTLEWNFDLTNEQPSRLVEWRTEEGVPITHAGSVRFEPAPSGQGTVVHVAFEYDRSVGRSILAKVSGQDPTTCEILESLNRFKALLETGEIPTVEGQPRGLEK